MEVPMRFRVEAAELQEKIGYGTVSAGSDNGIGAYAVVDLDTLHRLVGDRDRARKMLDVAGMALAEIEERPSGELDTEDMRTIARNALGALNELSAL